MKELNSLSGTSTYFIHLDSYRYFICISQSAYSKNTIIILYNIFSSFNNSHDTNQISVINIGDYSELHIENCS